MDATLSATSGPHTSWDDGCARSAPAERAPSRLVPAGLVLVTLLAIAPAAGLRWSMAVTTAWHCDEIPLLVRSTGLCGHVAAERDAARFSPSFYSWYMGSLRAIRAPRDVSAIHTTTNFWVNLTTHLFGITPAAGRVMPLAFSILAMAIAGWAAWLMTGRVAAACLAAAIVAWSPHAIAYGAQARGYAEAMALAGLLLVVLEYLRRGPSRRFRAAAVLVVAAELSLTVYTAWLYWALPALAVAVTLLPRLVRPGERGAIRSVLSVTVLGIGLLMAIYTIDRWASLTFTAGNMGVGVSNWGEACAFVGRTGAHLLPVTGIALLAVGIGVAVAWRSPVRWWLAVVGAGVAVPAGFALLNGSGGYERNFGYLVVPLAVLAGAGAEAVVRRVMQRLPRAAATVAAAGLVLGGSLWVRAGSEAGAQAAIEPDWGAATMALRRVPETSGPRWLGRCLANHWPINWYAADGVDRVVGLPRGATMELVLGSQFDERGREIVFRADVADRAIVPAELPHYLAGSAGRSTFYGVNLRRWRGAESASVDPAAFGADTPVFVMTYGPRVGGTSERIQAFLETDVRSQVVSFKPTDVNDHVFHTLIVPGTAIAEVRRTLEREPTTGAGLRYFRLEPLPPLGPTP